MMTRANLRIDDTRPIIVALEADDLVAQVMHTKRGRILTCGGYLRPGIGLRGVNLIRLQHLAGVVGSWNGPWLAYFDWNITPEQLRASKWMSKLDARILQPQDAAFTCTAGQQRLLDFVVHSADMEDMLQLRRVPTPWISHRGL